MAAYEADVTEQKKLNLNLEETKKRLMSRSSTLVVYVPFDSPEGPFTIKCRSLNVSEQTEAIKILNEYRRVENNKTAETKLTPQQIIGKLEEMRERIINLLAYPEGINLDGLDKEYWLAGNYTPDVIMYIVNYVMMHQNEAVLNARLFRGKQ